MTCNVICRIRPIENDFGMGSPVIHRNLDMPESIILTSSKKSRHHFSVNKVFWPDSSQSEVFDHMWGTIRSTILLGNNATILAYGHSGSGKTYTMMGIPSCPHQCGLIPRLASGFFDLFHAGRENSRDDDLDGRSQAMKSNLNRKIRNLHISFLEIYNDRVMDLLSLSNSSNWLKVREHPEKGTFVEGLQYLPINSVDDLDFLLAMGNKNRSTAETSMNVQSSRSHCIFTIHVSIQSNTGCYTSRINLVDLAGSERIGKTNLKGMRLQESLNINRTLSALGDVLNALVREENFVPFRNCVLTWLLKDSVGGSSFTTFIATLSPNVSHYKETLSTLRYVEVAQLIENKPILSLENEEGNGETIQSLWKEIKRLKKELGNRPSNGKWANSTPTKLFFLGKLSGISLMLRKNRLYEAFVIWKRYNPCTPSILQKYDYPHTLEKIRKKGLTTFENSSRNCYSNMKHPSSQLRIFASRVLLNYLERICKKKLQSSFLKWKRFEKHWNLIDPNLGYTRRQGISVPFIRCTLYEE